MKTKILQLFLIIPVLLTGSLTAKGQNTQIDKLHTGKWSFDAPTAPDGYTFGMMDLKKDSVIMTFVNANDKYPSSWIKVKADSLIYSTVIDGEDVLFSLDITNNDTIKGNAVWSDGQTKMIIKRKPE
jgi:hypothetical protein